MSVNFSNKGSREFTARAGTSSRVQEGGKAGQPRSTGIRPANPPRGGSGVTPPAGVERPNPSR